MHGGAAVVEGFPNALEPQKKQGARAREAANAASVELAKLLEAEGREPSSDERRTLLMYSGLGGTNASSNDPEGNTLGLLNEYHTPVGVARAIWNLLARVGVNGGIALEPSAGTGVFLETAPDPFTFTAVELNPDAVRINRLLHPNATVRASSFEADCHHSAELEFDLIVGNPPFGPRGMNGLEAKPRWTSYAPYFVDAALDRLRDGGVLAFVLPSGLQDAAKHLGFRSYVLARTRLRTLLRLPISTFEVAGARAATDVVVLEKRPWVVGDTLAELVARFGPRVLASAGVVDAAARDFLRGQFHDSRPECVLGTMVADPRWGGRVCEGILDDATLERMGNAAPLESPVGAASLGRLLKTLESSPGFSELASATNVDVRSALEQAWKAARATGYPHRDGLERAGGQVFRFALEGGRWTRGWQVSKAALHPAVESGLGVADKLCALRAGDREAAEALRVAALGALHRHLQAHGNPHAGLLLTTAAKVKPALYRLLGAVRADGAIAPFLLEPRNQVLERSSDLEMLCERLDLQQRLTVEALLEVWEGGTREAARAALLESDVWMLTPEGRFTATARYAVGDVLEKAALSRAQAELEGDFETRQKLLLQAAQLEALKPRRTLEEIGFAGTEGWIPTEVVRAWLEETYPYLEYERNETNGRVTVVVDAERLRDARVGRGQADEDAKMLARFFNLEHTAKMVTDAKTMTSEQYAAARKARIEQAQQHERALGLRFLHFVAGDLERRTLLEDRYNALLNSFHTGEDDTRPLALSGWSQPTPHGYQNHGVRFTGARPNALIAFDTGLGKTLVGAAITESLLESARASRAGIVVPKGLLVNWTRTLARAVPFRRVVTVGLSTREDSVPLEDDESTVLEKLHAFALGAFDLLLISRDWFRRLRLRPETLRAFVAREASLLAVDCVDADEDEGKPTARAQTLTLAERQTSLASRVSQGNALRQIHFEDLGLDALVVDEAGSLKNLYAAPTYFGRKPKFMGASLESDRALDTLFKVQSLHTANGGRNVTFLTATPTKNSPLELFNILKPLAGETFSRLGIFGPAQFVERYCQIETVLHPNAAGTLEAVPGVVGFKNLTELRGLMARFILHRTAADVGLEIPDLETIEHVFELNPQQQAIYAQLRESAQVALRDPRGDHGIHLFSVYAQMRLLTLEPSLYSSGLDANPRFERAARIAVNAVRDGGKVVCFMDVGNASDEDETGSRRKRSGPDTFELLKKALVYAGVPGEWIAIVTAERVKGAKRQQIADAYNSGQLRVILGSTGTIGEGFDLQVGTTDLVHLDIPWDPGTFHQRVGRGHRQGNEAATVRNHILLARGSFDGLTYATMRGKRGWQQQLWHSSEDRARNTAVLGYDELLAALSDDPDAARLEIERKRADIETARLAQRRALSMAQFRLYIETLDHQTMAWHKARRRKKGPTANDLRLRDNFGRQLERYREALRDDHGFGDQALLDGRCCLVTAGDVALGAGSRFRLEDDGSTHTFEVEEIEFSVHDGVKCVLARALEGGAQRRFREHALEAAEPISVTAQTD
jgi:hypothetical protein